MQSDVCGQCGYELVGIARSGRCPECGRPYDLDSGRGTARRREPWLLRHARTCGLVALAVVIVLCSGLLSLAASNALGLVLTGLLVGGVVLIGAVLSYLTEKQDQREMEDA